MSLFEKTYSIIQSFPPPIYEIFRDGCVIAIPDSDTVVINDWSIVSVYGEGGWILDLPELNEERAGHGCTSYIHEGKRVRYEWFVAFVGFQI